jgi:maltose-binding protein MalE
MLTGEENYVIMPANVGLVNSLMMGGDPVRVTMGETAMNARYLSNKPEMSCVWDALNSALNNVINEVASYSSFANDAQAQADSCIIELNK